MSASITGDQISRDLRIKTPGVSLALGNFAGILSGPVAFVTSRALSTDWTSLTVSVNSDISGEAGALAALPDEGGGGGVMGEN